MPEKKNVSVIVLNISIESERLLLVVGYFALQ